MSGETIRFGYFIMTRPFWGFTLWTGTQHPISLPQDLIQGWWKHHIRCLSSLWVIHYLWPRKSAEHQNNETRLMHQFVNCDHNWSGSLPVSLTWVVERFLTFSSALWNLLLISRAQLIITSILVSESQRQDEGRKSWEYTTWEGKAQGLRIEDQQGQARPSCEHD